MYISSGLLGQFLRRGTFSRVSDQRHTLQHVMVDVCACFGYLARRKGHTPAACTLPPPPLSSPTTEHIMSRRLYLGRLPPDSRQEDVTKFFEGEGRIVDCRVMTGFGFVEFENSQDAELAMNNNGSKPFLGQK
jgi:hypothetical protein